jgi:hypothetical protein
MSTTAPPEIQTPDTIGAPFEGGFYGGQIKIGLTMFAIVWAPKAEGETTGQWLPNHTLIAEATSCCDSMANTQAMAEAGSPIAKWALGLNINGHKDWCLPSRDVLELGYRHLKPGTNETYCSFRDGDNPSSVPVGYPYDKQAPIVQTMVEAFQAGGAEAFDETWHWASTVYSSASAWCQGFLDGYQLIYGQTRELRARAVRMIPLNS